MPLDNLLAVVSYPQMILPLHLTVPYHEHALKVVRVDLIAQEFDNPFKLLPQQLVLFVLPPLSSLWLRWWLYNQLIFL